MSAEMKKKDRLQTVPVFVVVIELLKQKGISFWAIEVLARLYAKRGYCPPKAIPALIEAFCTHMGVGKPGATVGDAIASLKEQAELNQISAVSRKKGIEAPEKIKEDDGLQTVPIHELVIEQLRWDGVRFSAVEVLARLYAKRGYCPPKAIPALVEAFSVHMGVGNPGATVGDAIASLKEQAEASHEDLDDESVVDGS